MKSENPGDRLVAMFLLGVLLFSPPLLAIFSPDALVFGVPLLYLYLFCGWAMLIALVAVFGRADSDNRPEQPSRAPANEE